MSIRIMSAVWDRFEGDGGELLLALALADFADDDGANIYPSVARLARKTRRSERAVQAGLARLRILGWLQLVSEAGQGKRTRQYRIAPSWILPASRSQAWGGSER